MTFLVWSILPFNLLTGLVASIGGESERLQALVVNAGVTFLSKLSILKLKNGRQMVDKIKKQILNTLVNRITSLFSKCLSQN